MSWGSLRNELLQAEQTHIDLESEKFSLVEKFKFLEMEKQKVDKEKHIFRACVWTSIMIWGLSGKNYSSLSKQTWMCMSNLPCGKMYVPG